MIMKKTVFQMMMAVLAAVCLTSCSKTPEDDVLVTDDAPAQQETYVTLHFSPYIQEAMTRGAGDKSIQEICSRLDIWLEDDDQVIEVHQSSSDAGFGSVSVKLNITRTYTLYAVAHNSDAPVTFEDGLVSFDDDIVTDAFYCRQSITPSAVINCTMTRFVGQFALWITDAIPENAARITFSSASTNTQFNLTIGAGTSKDERVREFTSWQSSSSGTLFNFYIIPDNLTAGCTVDVVATVYDGDDNIIETRTFEDVPIQAAYRSIYKGTFFVTSDMSYSFVACSTWTDSTTDF